MKASQLFHVADRALSAGEAVRPYGIAREYPAILRLAVQALEAGPDAVQRLLSGEAWDHLRRHGGDRAEMVLMEAAFERARLLTAPQLPSRLDVVYAWGSLALAERFRAGYRPAGVIHRCTLVAGTTVERDAALVIEAFEAADLTDPSAAHLRQVEELAVRYWRARGSMVWPEVLIHGTVVVKAVIEAGDEARPT